MEPVEPSPITSILTALFVFHESWNQMEPVEPKIIRQSLRFVALLVGV